MPRRAGEGAVAVSAEAGTRTIDAAGAATAASCNSLTAHHDNALRERGDSDRPGPDDAAARMHDRLPTMRSVSPPGHLRAVGQRSRAARQQRGGGATSAAPAVQPVRGRGRGASCDVLRTLTGGWTAPGHPPGRPQQVVDLQQMGRGAATPGERITITAAPAVALPDVAPDRRRNVTPRRGLAAAADSIAGRVLRCRGRCAARSAVRGHAECRPRRRSGDRRDRHASVHIGAIRRGAARELRRRGSGGHGRWNATCAGAIQKCSGR